MDLSCIKCPVCIDYYETPVCLECGHILCNECLRSLQQQRCPICSEIIENKKYPFVECLQNPYVSKKIKKEEEKTKELITENNLIKSKIETLTKETNNKKKI